LHQAAVHAQAYRQIIVVPEKPFGRRRLDGAAETVGRGPGAILTNTRQQQIEQERLAAVYEEALLALHIGYRDDPINKVIAQRIIERARAGVGDPNALCKMAVKDLMVP